MTTAGALDVLGAIEHGAGYEDLVADVVPLELGLSQPVRVLSSRRIIALKQGSAHPKDVRTVAALSAILALDSVDKE